MPKKKPIDKRLNSLFNNINPEQTHSDPKAGMQDRASDPDNPSAVENATAPMPGESSQTA